MTYAQVWTADKVRLGFVKPGEEERAARFWGYHYQEDADRLIGTEGAPGFFYTVMPKE